MPRIARRPVSELTGHLGYWLRQVSNHVSHAFARRLESRAVTVAEWAVLRALYAGEALAPSRLADQLGLTRAAISKLAERLVAKRLASRARNTSDGRAQTLTLTTKGRSLVPKLPELADRNDAGFFARLASEERASVERLLREIVRMRGLKVTSVD